MRGIDAEALAEIRWLSAANEDFEVGAGPVVSLHSGWDPYRVWESRVKTPTASLHVTLGNEECQ
jgi:hypothetical protein